LVVRTLDATFDNVESMCESVRAWNLHFQPLSTGRGILDVGRVVQSEAAVPGAFMKTERMHVQHDWSEGRVRAALPPAASVWREHGLRNAEAHLPSIVSAITVQLRDGPPSNALRRVVQPLDRN